ncbi:tagatose-bisphosphate aldolase [Sphaerochaeta halotolerans]|uniref:Tagatose-bisphosphate aldolase n=1 Tax=Sphaerochaeta halotolerans TaxID=2293840 RepID=A0A372MK33_9SPIR|nr:class II D-tagatose-bisphosphate aldolase, non-catalytic subunit [Sphaerochaeta halotolerans]RFU96094.1 tagatose-bisphosphate aldolase [Sphaerochaeta halotolerans]
MIVREFMDLVRSNKHDNKRVGVFSICSAHPVVLEASLLHAKRNDYLLVIEATSNQVNQFGGYTGMRPVDFYDYIRRLAKGTDYPFDRILLGGDHLGPNMWKNENAEIAMEKACEMIRQYVVAGFRKIHLDASMFCKDDKGDRSKPLDDKIVAERAARLCKVAEETWSALDNKGEPPCYIIGTEVPIPGGMTSNHHGVNPTEPEAAVKTITVTREVFVNNGLESAWDRVVGLVIQPGVEFGDDTVVMYDPDKAHELHQALAKYDSLVCEAHSTDYQTEGALSCLVEDHCCILKVGPWVTYAYREVLFALESIEKELAGKQDFTKISTLRKTIEEVMVENPQYWKNYYAEGPDLPLTMAYSYSDRVRYYWEQPKIKDAVQLLRNNLKSIEIPRSLLSQYLPIEYLEIMEGKLSVDLDDIIYRHIQLVLDTYRNACG